MHAGEILSSNAPQQEKTSATWPNPSQLDVVFEPIVPLAQTLKQLAPWAAGALVLIVLVIGIMILASRSRARPIARAGYRSVAQHAAPLMGGDQS